MNYSTEILLCGLKEKFKHFSFTYLEIEYSGIIPVFFIKVNCKEKELLENWKRIVDYIGVNFQTSLESEFAVWNIYLFFITKYKVSDSLKYRIENDTFSSRKIIIEDNITEKEIINDHILNNDLSFGKVKIKSNQFKHNDLIWKFIKDKEPKKKITEEDKRNFVKIVEKLKEAK